MANNLTTQDADLATLPNSSAIATVQLSDSSHAGYAVLGDPTTRTQLAAVTAKATQGAFGLAVQPLKDAGRSSVALTIDTYVVAATAETLVGTMKSTVDLAAPTTGLSFYTVTANKRLRIQTITANLHTITGKTTVAACIVRVRAAVSGSITTGSPIIGIAALADTAGVNQASGAISINIPDGFEMPAAATIGFTVECPGYVVTTAAPKMDLTLFGYEY